MAICLLLLCGGCRSGKKAVHAVPGHGSEWNYDSGGRQTAEKEKREQTSRLGRDLAAEAKRWLGTPYSYGGHSRRGTDCSGMVMEVYEKVCGVKLPRTTGEQADFCIAEPLRSAGVGDLVFFSSSKNRRDISHVGLYIGRGEMIHASSSQGVTTSRIDEGYWGVRFQKAGRVPSVARKMAKVDRRPEKNIDEVGKTSSKAPQAESHTPQNIQEVELLDLLISQKTDSILTSGQ